MIEMRQLRCFLAVAEEAHFTRAANRLHIAQPAVSHQIRQLERHLGISLFDRSPKLVRLTDAGHALLPHARAAFAALDAGRSAVHATAGSLRGQLTLGLVVGAGVLRVPALLGAFRRAHPDITVTLRQELPEAMLVAVREGGLDAAVVGIPDGAAIAGVSLRYLHTEPLAVAVATDHEWSQRRRLALAELDGVPLVTLTSGAGLRPLVQRACRQAGFEPVFACETNDLDLLAQLAAAQVGVAILPRSAAEATPGAVPITLTAPTLQRHLALAWRSSGTPSPVARRFVTYATTWLTQLDQPDD